MKYLKIMISLVSALLLIATLCGCSAKQPNEEKEIDLSNVESPYYNDPKMPIVKMNFGL